MKKLLSLVFVCISIAALMTAVRATGKPDTATNNMVLLLKLNGAIGPATADYIHDGLERAASANAQLVVLEMDTPGGLDTAMREIIKDILASPVPVVTFVAPSGSRAASAGTYILYASHIAAMAPATNLGAATPVQLMGGNNEPEAGKGEKQRPVKPETAEQRKQLNDAIAYIRSLAIKRSRNADWAEKAVRDAASMPAKEALAQHVIDLIAPNTASLLKALDGRTVTTAAGSRTLHTGNAKVENFAPGWRTTLLSVLTNPSVAYILMLLGIYGLLFEGYNPGAVLPGVVGGICLLLALYAFQILPVNFAGLALIGLGVILIISETFVPAYGSLGIGGIISFVIGSVILMDTNVPGFDIGLPLILSVSIVAALAVAGIVYFAVRSRYRPVVSGVEQMIGSMGVVLADFDSTGTIRVHGESWQAHTNQPLKTGQKVEVTSIEGLMLEVRPADANNQGEN